MLLETFHVLGGTPFTMLRGTSSGMSLTREKVTKRFYREEVLSPSRTNALTKASGNDLEANAECLGEALAWNIYHG